MNLGKFITKSKKINNFFKHTTLINKNKNLKSFFLFFNNNKLGDSGFEPLTFSV